MVKFTKNKNKRIKYRRRKSRTKKNRIKKNRNKIQYGGTYKIIGTGHKVKVLVEIDEPRFVYKVFEPSHNKILSTKQCTIQQQIQRFEEITTLFYVKIPKLFSCITDDTGETILKFERVYNINDTDINNPTQPTNILLRLDADIDAYNDKNDKPLNYITQFVDETVYRECVSQLGKMFGLLNFLCQIKTDDVEIVFGKLTIDGPPKLFILDFDQCQSYTLEKLLIFINSNVRYLKYDFDILGRKHDMTLNKLGEELKSIFNNGYLEYPRMLNPETVQLAETILNNYSK
jgi:hypothetical protein